MSRTLRGATDLVRFCVLFATSSSFRAAVHHARSATGGQGLETTQMTLEASRARPEVRVHRRLSGAALAFASIDVRAAAPVRVNLVLSEFDPTRLFAGVSTALDVANAVAGGTGVGLRLVTLSERISRTDGARIEREMATAGRPLTVVTRVEVAETTFNPDDLWLVTHWTTAHPVQVAVDDGRISADRVIYLVQDFEPGFAGWSTPSTVARDTYEAGFHLLVNSTPLRRYLVDRVGIPIDESRVFAPILAMERLRPDPTTFSRALAPADPTRVFFYGRPGKPRNLFDLGVAALEHATIRLGDRASAIEFISAGEAHPDVPLAGGAVLRSVGTLSWTEYFDLLSHTHVALSLQASPHPSHPPLEAAIAGAIAITNEFEHTREGLHPRLRAVEAHPMVLGDAIVAAIDEAERSGRGEYSLPTDGTLGRPLADVVRDLLAVIPRTTR